MVIRQWTIIYRYGGEMTFGKRCTVFIITILLMLISCAQALAVHREPAARSDAEYPATPEKVVEEYVRKDAEGARLSGDKFQEIRDLFMWEEAGFDGFTVITGHTIKTLSVGPDNAAVLVTYQELGDTSVLNWTPGKRKWTVTFALKRDGTRWRIAEPEILPHVLLDVAIDYLERFIASEDNEYVMKTLKQLKEIKKKGE